MSHLTEVQKVLLGGGLLRKVVAVNCAPWRGAADDTKDSPAAQPGHAPTRGGQAGP